jgi:hypothetical protein
MNTEEQKKVLLQKLREQYTPSTERYMGVTTNVTFRELVKLQKGVVYYNILKKQIFFKRNKAIYFIFFAFSLGCLIFGLYPYFSKGAKFTEQNGVNVFYGCLGIIITSILYFRRKKLLTLDENGIYYFKWNDYIKWSNVLVVFCKTTTSSDTEISTKNEMIIHYYSENYHTFISETFAISNLDTEPDNIIKRMEYFLE